MTTIDLRMPAARRFGGDALTALRARLDGWWLRRVTARELARLERTAPHLLRDIGVEPGAL